MTSTKKLYLVTSCYFHAVDKLHSSQCVIPRPLALFCYAEDAQAYVRQLSKIDRHLYEYLVGSWYEVSIVPFDPPKCAYRMRTEHAAALDNAFVHESSVTGGNSVDDVDIWDSLYERSWLYDLNGELFEYIDASYSDEMAQGRNPVSPIFRAGDLVSVRLGRTGGTTEIAYGVITNLITGNRGLVREYKLGDIFLGEYSFIYFDGYTCNSTWSIEKDIFNLESDLPKGAEILLLLAQHYKGEIKLLEEELDFLLRKQPFASCVEVFDFDRYGCKPTIDS